MTMSLPNCYFCELDFPYVVTEKHNALRMGWVGTCEESNAFRLFSGKSLANFSELDAG